MINTDTDTSAKTAWFHCFSGISGDMALGSLLDAGADIKLVKELLTRLDLKGWDLLTRTTLRGGISATLAVVSIASERSVSEEGAVKNYSTIKKIIKGAKLPKRVEKRSLDTFALLAQVEGFIHNQPSTQVVFHELGNLDTIIDIVGTASALEILEVENVYASSIAVGTGVVNINQHSALPNPAPATAALLATRNIPAFGRNLQYELATPTGTALLAATACDFGAMPYMNVQRVGYGAGSRELEEIPNLLQVVIGTVAKEKIGQGQPVVLLETNLDDLSGEVLSHSINVLLENNAYDAWLTPVVMKKGRPGYTLSVLVDPSHAERLMNLIKKETGTLGVRSQTINRWPSARTQHQVEIQGNLVGIKVSAHQIKVEYQDATQVADKTGIALRDVLQQARQKFEQQFNELS